MGRGLETCGAHEPKLPRVLAEHEVEVPCVPNHIHFGVSKSKLRELRFELTLVSKASASGLGFGS